MIKSNGQTVLGHQSQGTLFGIGMIAWVLVLASLSLGVTCWPLPIEELRACKADSKLPIPGECKQYLQCVKSNWEIQSCPWFQKFDYVSLSCKFIGASCAPLPPPPPTVPPTCARNGAKKPVDCINYKECVNNQWENKTCPTGSEFDRASLKCMFYGAKCDKPATTTGSPTTPTTTAPINECQLGHRKSVPNNCDKYFKCVSVPGGSEKWIGDYCPPNKYFQSSVCGCVYSWEVTCEKTMQECTAPV